MKNARITLAIPLISLIAISTGLVSCSPSQNDISAPDAQQVVLSHYFEREQSALDKAVQQVKVDKAKTALAKKQEQERLEAERIAQEAENARLEAERIQAEQIQAQEAEALRVAQEEEAARILAEQEAENARIAAQEQQAEQVRLAEEERLRQEAEKETVVVPPTPPVPPAPVPDPMAEGYAWINQTLANYGVYPPAGTTFLITDEGNCGGVGGGCTQGYANPGSSIFTGPVTIIISPSAGDVHVLFHEIGHSFNVGGECDAEYYAQSITKNYHIYSYPECF